MSQKEPPPYDFLTHGVSNIILIFKEPLQR